MGLIHRDIKPANIFASERGGVLDYTKLLDFGLVYAGNLDPRQARSSDKLIAGTPDYMSPEQIANSSDLDGRSDLYSLAAVAYFLLTGSPPFVRQTPIDVLFAHINEPAIPPSATVPEIPGDLESIVLRCLAKDPEQRVQDAETLERRIVGLCD